MILNLLAKFTSLELYQIDVHAALFWLLWLQILNNVQEI